MRTYYLHRADIQYYSRTGTIACCRCPASSFRLGPLLYSRMNNKQKDQATGAGSRGPKGWPNKVTERGREAHD
eukprot:3786547-Pleurochrysis_carterae.AAC.2